MYLCCGLQKESLDIRQTKQWYMYMYMWNNVNLACAQLYMYFYQ